MDKKKILVVDDEKECCAFFEDYLTKRGHLIDTAYDGLAAKGKNPKAKKIMISGYDLINEDFAKYSGVDIFLRKPISLETVKEIIENT